MHASALARNIYSDLDVSVHAICNQRHKYNWRTHVFFNMQQTYNKLNPNISLQNNRPSGTQYILFIYFTKFGETISNILIITTKENARLYVGTKSIILILIIRMYRDEPSGNNSQRQYLYTYRKKRDLLE